MMILKKSAKISCLENWASPGWQHTFLVLRGDAGIVVPAGALWYQLLPPAVFQGGAVAHVAAHGLAVGLDGDDWNINILWLWPDIDRNKQINAGCTWGCLSCSQVSNEIQSLPTMQCFAFSWTLFVSSATLLSPLSHFILVTCIEEMQSYDEYIFHPSLASTIIIFLSQLYLEPTSDFLLSIFGWIQLNIAQWILSESDWFSLFLFSH